jgi:hypothetical protein
MAFKRETIDQVVAFLDAMTIEMLKDKRPPRPRTAGTAPIHPQEGNSQVDNTRANQAIGDRRIARRSA